MLSALFFDCSRTNVNLVKMKRNKCQQQTYNFPDLTCVYSSVRIYIYI